MYQALYRKYRPKNFNEIVGQDVIVRTLKNMINNNSLTHAYLFTGPRGTGKTSVAKILAKTINCENKNDGISCEKCVSCTQINNKQSIDIIEIDAASNNGVDEIREIKNKVNLVPSNSKYKVYIIDEVHMLTTGAFNALLKTLEEPPSHIIFILATTEPHKIPATILSRCQRFDFKRISDTALFNRLKEVCQKENIEIDDIAIAEVARISDGGMRDALSILDQISSYADGKITVEDVHTVNGTLTQTQLSGVIDCISKSDLFQILQLTDEWNESGKNFAKILEELMLFYKNLLISKQAPKYLNAKGIDVSLFSNLNVSENVILNNIDVLNRKLVEIKKSNMPKLIFEITILELITKYKEKFLIENKIPKESKETKEIKVSSKNIQIEEKKDDNVLKDNKIDNEIKEKLKEIKSIRINNTLATFDKKELMKIKEQQDNLRALLINPDYSQIVSMIFDGTLKAAGSNHLIYVFDNETNSDLFNQNILKIESILEQEFGKKYFVISTDIISWEIIKENFNSKLKKYEYIEENIDINEILKESEEKNDIESLFINTIQYN